jgi:arylsulfatase A-like enzyme
MYSFDQIRKGLADPGMIGQEVNRFWYAALNDGKYNDDGVHVFEEDWDNMLILDACRFDEFRERSALPGSLKKRKSLASMTHEWVSANFTGRQLHDTVYVSANGQYLNDRENHGAEVHEFVGLITDTHRHGSGEGKFTPPDLVTEEARSAAASFPKKRLLVHYLQPHNPYLGPSGADFEYHSSLDTTVKRSPVTESTLREAYRENLDMVLDEVETLIQELDGLTVVTSDHGELLGERERPIPVKRYGHPRGIYMDELVEIPWLEYQNGDRREIVAEEPRSDLEYDEENVKEHLRDIGYAV